MPPLSSRNEAAAVMLRLRWIAKPGPFWDPKRPFSRSTPNFGKGSRAVMSGLRSEAQRPVSAPPTAGRAVREGWPADKAFDGADDRIVPETGPWGSCVRGRPVGCVERTGLTLRLRSKSTSGPCTSGELSWKGSSGYVIGSARLRKTSSPQPFCAMNYARTSPCHENVNGSHTRRCYRVKH